MTNHPNRSKRKSYPTTAEGMMEDIDTACAPHVMSQQEAIDWLEDLASLIHGRIEAIRDDLRNQR